MEEECEHVRALKLLLSLAGFKIWAADTPQRGVRECGWVNVSCDVCHTTFEVDLDRPTAQEER